MRNAGAIVAGLWLVGFAVLAAAKPVTTRVTTTETGQRSAGLRSGALEPSGLRSDARSLGLDDTSGLSPAYLYFRMLLDPSILYRRLKAGGEFQVQCSIPWRKFDGGAAAIDPSGRWIADIGLLDSCIRRHDVVTGEYADHNTGLPSYMNVGCDSEYIYEHVGCNIFRFRLSDVSFVDSTRIDQLAQARGFGVANDSLWIGDTIGKGFYVYPAASMTGDSAHPARFQPLGNGLFLYTNVIWDGQYYYVSLADQPANGLRRYTQDWSGYDENPLGHNIYCPMAVARPLPDKDVGTVRVIPPRGPIQARTPTTVRALVMNFGAAAQGPFDVVLALGGLRRTQTVSSLNPGDSVEVAFSSFVPDSSGIIMIRCSTALSGDRYPSNDAAVDTVGTVVADYIETFEPTNGGFAADPPDKWAWGVPSAPRPPPRSGENVWGDRLQGYYDGGEVSSLVSPEYQALIDTPVVCFYHWYQFHSDDGGNCSYSTDNGATWQLIYPWTTSIYWAWINILQEEGWGGSSLTDWRKEMLKIPVSRGTSFNIRWRLGSDSTNIAPGWIVDDVAGIGFVRSDVAVGEAGSSARALLSVTPSLVRNSARIRYALPRAGPVNLKLYDLTGRLTRTLAAGPHKAGAYVVPLNAAGLARGVYILRLEAGAFRATRKVIVD